MDRLETLCIRCGLPLGDPLRLNTREDGSPCPACRDRVLDALPPLLPKEVAEPQEVAEEAPPPPSSDASPDDTARLPGAEGEEDWAG